MKHRMKMCEHCAFRDNSVEMRDPQRKEHITGQCLHKVFYCHETMFQKNPEDTKWIGDFDPERKPNGSKAKQNDHQVCAGFIKYYGDEFGIDGTNIPVENHAMIKAAQTEKE